MITEAIVLAGGLGTRLRSAVPDLPKCMAPVAGRPFLQYIINYYGKQGIENFIFCLGYKHEIIEAFLVEEYPSLQYKISLETEPLGTGGAIAKACELATTDTVLGLNGDTFYSVDLQELESFHNAKKADCSLVLKPMRDSERYGIVETDDTGRIISFKEKKWYANSLINGGVYALNIFSLLEKSMTEKFSFEKDFLEKYYFEADFYGSVQDRYFIDIGIPEDFARAQEELKDLL